SSFFRRTLPTWVLAPTSTACSLRVPPTGRHPPDELHKTGQDDQARDPDHQLHRQSHRLTATQLAARRVDVAPPGAADGGRDAPAGQFLLETLDDRGFRPLKPGFRHRIEGYEIHVAQETFQQFCEDRKSTRLNSSHVKISYAVFC